MRNTVLREFLKSFPSPSAHAPLHVSLAGETYPDPTYYVKRARSNLAVIEYVKSGEGYVLFGGKYHHVCKDTVYFLFPDVPHDYYADTDAPFSKIFMNVSGTLLERLIASYNLSEQNLYPGEGLLPIFERIPELIASDLTDDEMQASLQGIFTEILARLSFAQSATAHSEEAIALKNFIDSSSDCIVTSAMLSKVIFRSPDYCLKLFKSEFGTTPYSYQIDRKMDTAKSLLCDTSLSIGEIASMLGYSDAHYFSNLFTQKCGIRPLAYRKSKK